MNENNLRNRLLLAVISLAIFLPTTLQAASLTISKPGAGKGTVTSNPSGITCGSTCSASFASSTSVTLTATADASSTFSGWLGGSCMGTSACTVGMNTSKTVTAVFNGVSGNTYIIPLYTGWNLISLPLQPADISIGKTLSSISGGYSIVWEFTPRSSWKSYDPNDPTYSDLQYFSNEKGYWLKSNVDTILTVTGTDPAKTIKPAPGWNLIGYPKTSELSIETAIQSVAGKYSIVWEFAPPSIWKSYDPNDPTYSDLKIFAPAKGYWIKMKETLVSIAVTPANPNIAIGSTGQFTATGTYSDNTTINITSSVTWSSSNTGIATISNTGLVTPIAAGSTTITATSESISGSTTLTVTATGEVGAVLQSTGPFGALMVNKGGEMLLPMVERDSSGNATKVTGALYVDNNTGNSVAVYLGDDGMPTKTVIGEFILLFSNWSADGTTVDITKIYTPGNYIEIFRGASVNAIRAANLSTSPLTIHAMKTCFPKCTTGEKQLAETLKIAGWAISITGCGGAMIVAFPAALPVFMACGGLIVNTASLLVGDEWWLNKLADTGTLFTVADGIKCILKDLESCVSVGLDLAARIFDKMDKDLNNHSALTFQAHTFASNPAQPSGVAQQGSGLPVVPSGAYECTPGGSMSYVPCYPTGVRECNSSYRWGSCVDGSCTYTYSAWSACQPDNTQTRTFSSSPVGCTGTPGATKQSCTYCGNGKCESGENSFNCPGDCADNSCPNSDSSCCTMSGGSQVQVIKVPKSCGHCPNGNTTYAGYIENGYYVCDCDYCRNW